MSAQTQNKNLTFTNLFVTARKRSLGQGNMFAFVCLSTGGWCLVLGGVWSGGAWSQGVWSWGVPGGDPPERLLLWAVCILLECILVFDKHILRYVSTVYRPFTVWRSLFLFRIQHQKGVGGGESYFLPKWLKFLKIRSADWDVPLLPPITENFFFSTS